MALFCKAQSILEPNSETLWMTGDEVSITWTSGNITTSSVDVNLMVGPGSGVVIMPIASDLPITMSPYDPVQTVAFSYPWLVNDNLSSRNDYFIRVSKGNTTLIAMSERFNIESPAESQSNAAVVGARLAAILWTILLFSVSLP